MIQFDKKKIEYKYGTPSYKIEYFICLAKGNAINFTVDSMKLKRWKNKENKENRSCFAAFHRMVTSFISTHKTPPNRILYICEKNFKNIPAKLHLSDKEIKRWVELCKKNRLMPKNIGKHFLKSMCFIVDLERVSYNRLYMYLTAARYIHEAPHFVRSMLHLIDDLGLDFFVAFPVASMWSAANTGHHILPIGRDYSMSMFNGDMNKTTNNMFNRFDMRYAAKLAQYAFNTEKEPAVTKDSRIDFNLHGAIKRVTLKGANRSTVTREHLLSEELVKAVRSGDFTEVSKLKIV